VKVKRKKTMALIEREGDNNGRAAKRKMGGALKSKPGRENDAKGNYGTRTGTRGIRAMQVSAQEKTKGF